MDSLTTKIEISVPREKAFDCFVNRLTHWWPKEYTWSNEKLVELSIDPVSNGLCSEIGPNGFRCDWGTVLTVDSGRSLSMKWQLTFERNPEPDADKASVVHIQFEEVKENQTCLHLIHEQFSNHGENHEKYRNAMASARGWPYLLSSFATYIHRTDCRELPESD
ncbi:Uncharacterized conserved protein YndB, AHSA1/START domain [Parapedobacter composti]|uniref:Uncharacterized conserved protein YndB, AHSA1/START domain n=1 Tax=Parapedobacter composti TaxID=623281 RepID=A0A1I1KWQ5_9SPHI|nr:SRPBCC domain-containing protein [Parapedobacter composti]SFC65234.1 Uncharacterized conserved protein YndB, AHSA1/START domain [Parapedobacter composti]